MSVYPIISLGLNTRSCLLFSMHWALKSHYVAFWRRVIAPLLPAPGSDLLLLVPLFFLWGSRAWTHSLMVQSFCHFPLQVTLVLFVCLRCQIVEPHLYSNIISIFIYAYCFCGHSLFLYRTFKSLSHTHIYFWWKYRVYTHIHTDKVIIPLSLWSS